MIALTSRFHGTLGFPGEGPKGAPGGASGTTPVRQADRREPRSTPRRIWTPGRLQGAGAAMRTENIDDSDGSTEVVRANSAGLPPPLPGSQDSSARHVIPLLRHAVILGRIDS